MKISELANLQNETDWVLSPTLLGLILGILGAIVAISTSTPTPNIQQNQSPTQSAELATGINDADFNKALPHILKWEGKCSDHWADSGGRTYKGITTEVARKHGYKGDVCRMKDDEVYSIYYKDYWARVPQSLGFNEKLVHFNMIINGTSNRCLNAGDALAMVNCQQEYYNSLSAKNQRNFANGWRNRNNYIKSVVSK